MRIAFYAVLATAPWLYRLPSAYAVTVVCTGLTLVLAAATAISTLKVPKDNLAIIALATVMGATVLQVVPLPHAVVAAVSPTAAEYHAVAGIDGVSVLSLDPPSTVLSLFHWAALILVVVICNMLFRERGKLRELSGFISILGGVFVVVAIADAAVHHGETDAGSVASGFVNANHFGAFCGFACFSSIAVALSQSTKHRGLFVGNAILCALGVLMSLSRGAIGALAIVGLVYLVLTLVRWNTWRVARWVAPVMCATAAAGVALVWVALTREVSSNDKSAIKFEVWKRTLGIIRDFKALGVGRGAFSGVFTRYDDTGALLTFTHVENSLLQTLVDYGAFIGGALIVLVLLCLFKAGRRSFAGADRMAAFCGILTLAVQNLADFNTALLPVAMPAIAVLSLLMSEHARRDSESSGVSRRKTLEFIAARRVRPALIVASIAVVMPFVAMPAIRARLGADTVNIREAATRGDRGAVESILHRHPADWILPASAAEIELTHGDVQSALRHINNAMFLAPHNDVPHRLAAAALIKARNVGQAALETELAIRARPDHASAIVAEVLHQGMAPATLSTLGHNDADTALALASALHTNAFPAPALATLEPWLSPTSSPAMLEVAIRAAIASENWQETLRLAGWLEHAQPKNALAYVAAAKAEHLSQHHEAALAILDRGVAHASNTNDVLDYRSEVLRELGSFPEAMRDANAMLEHAIAQDDVARAQFQRGNILRDQGRNNDALAAYRAARELAPNVAYYRLMFALALERNGDRSGALRELEVARNELGPDPALDAQRARLGTR